MASEDGLRKFDGAVAVITGGASGIGRGFGEVLAAKGCEVVLADRQVELAKKVASGINERGGSAHAVELDVRDFAAVEELVQQTVRRTGRIDYIFNNAGISNYGSAHQCGIDDY